MNKKGFLNKNNERIENFNNSKNINNKGLKLNQFLEKMKFNLSQLIHFNRYISACLFFSDYKLTSTNTYEELTNVSSLGIRTDGNIVERVSNSNAQLKMTTERNYTVIDFNALCISQNPGVKYAKLEIIRNGQVLIDENISNYVNQRGIIRLSYIYNSRIDDILKISLYGTTNDEFLRVKLFLTSSYVDKNYEKYI